MAAKDELAALLRAADIEIDGSNPWDVRVHDERFYRMWRYYLNSTAGAFRARSLNLWQLVLSRGDVPRYVPVR